MAAHREPSASSDYRYNEKRPRVLHERCNKIGLTMYHIDLPLSVFAARGESGIDFSSSEPTNRTNISLPAEIEFPIGVLSNDL